MMLGLNSENKDIRERAERVLSGLKQVEAEYELTRDKIVEKTEWGYRIRYVERNRKRHGKRLSENGTGHAAGATGLEGTAPERHLTEEDEDG